MLLFTTENKIVELTGIFSLTPSHIVAIVSKVPFDAGAVLEAGAASAADWPWKNTKATSIKMVRMNGMIFTLDLNGKGDSGFTLGRSSVNFARGYPYLIKFTIHTISGFVVPNIRSNSIPLEHTPCTTQ